MYLQTSASVTLGLIEPKLPRHWGISANTARLSEDVSKLLADKIVSPHLFDVLRRMKPARQIEAVQLMSIVQNFTATYAKALLRATKHADRLASSKPAIMGLIAERMEAEMSSLQRQLGSLESSLGEVVLQLVARLDMYVV